MMSSAGSPLSYNNNVDTRKAIHYLQDLLDILHPDPTPDVLTLNSLEYRYKLHDGLNQAAIRDIEQSQHINRAIGDYWQSGLNEFHIGLIYLFWGECHAAEKEFDLAWRHWSIGHEQLADLALALFGRGYAQEISHHHEAAMISYAKTRRYLERMPLNTDTQATFHGLMESYLREAQQTLRDKMRHLSVSEVEQGPPEDEANEGVVPVAEAVDDRHGEYREDTGQPPIPQPPRTNLSDDPLPLDGHEKVDGRYRWYLVEQRQLDGFIPQIQSQDWLLVFTQPDQSDLAYRGEQPIVIVCQSESSSTIMLRPHPSEQMAHGRRIYLREWPGESWSFVRHPDSGEIFLTPADGQDVVDLEKLIGIVIGLWRPSAQVVREN